jgi:glycine C-acetyltransferase
MVSPKVIQSAQGAYLIIDGVKKLNLCSSHYLGLAHNDKVIQDVALAIERYGIGTGYRTLAGTHQLHVELEQALASFKRTEAAIVLTGGYMANCAAIQTIIRKDDIVISDELNHASIIDAIRLSGVKNKYIYRHSDMEHLKQMLAEASRIRGEHDVRILVVTDGVFSMDGDIARLPEIVSISHAFEALVMVDDAHGEGVLGEGGRGIVDHFGLHGEVDVEVGTLSKAFSVMGGFISGRKDLIDYYKQKARQYLFSNALTIPDTAALLAAVSILNESDELVKKLWENAAYLKQALTEAGFDVGVSQTPITPVMLGDEERARYMSKRLFEYDVFATAITYPMVAQGAARIRLIPSAAHTREDLDKGINALIRVRKELSDSIEKKVIC